MNPQGTRDLIFYNRGLKEGAMYVLNLSQYGLNEFLRKTQEYIDGSKDTEILLVAEMQKTSNPPPSLL